MRGFIHSCILFYFLLPGKLAAQSDSAIRSSAITHAIKQYHKTVSPPTGLLNGPEYFEYAHTIHIGHPFFDTTAFGMGSVMYDNILYENVPLKFDYLKNVLITQNPVLLFPSALFSEKVNYFNVHGHTFIRIEKDETARAVSTGFYDLLYNGSSLQLLKKENKSVQVHLSQPEGARRFIVYTVDYYIKTKDGYFHADTHTGVLRALNSKRSEIQQYIRSNKLKFKKEVLEKTLLSITAYYDSLSK